MLDRLIFMALLLLPAGLWAQIGGERSYDFLNLPVNARQSAMGGQGISLSGEEYNQWLANPAAMDSSSVGGASINFMDYFAGSSYTNVSYVFGSDRLPKGLQGVGVGFQYLGHGDMESFDPAGNSLGTFDANELAITVGTSHEWGPFTIGANLKYVGSNIEAFRSSAILMDIGGLFYPTANRQLAVGLAFRNFGFVLSDYSETSDSSVPFDVQLGATFKPKYMPVRFTITAYNLTRDDVVYFDQQLADNNEQEPGFSEQLFRRLNFGFEFLLSENFQLQAGYNHLTRKELRLNQVSGGAGFSFGMLVKIKRIGINYGRAFYHTAGASNYFSINTNINNFIKKKS
ncbi:MAG: type IX secretion system protein PorQ [Cyclobacteriaceae bacterium]